MIWRWLGFGKDSYQPEKDIGPYSNYRLAIRLELNQKPGVFAKLTNAIAKEGASIGAVDMISATKTKVVRDITLDTKNEEHGQRVLDRLEKLPDVKVLSASDRIFMLHLGGKLKMGSKFQISTRNTLSMAYTPGVGRVSQAIAKDPSLTYRFTSKSNSVAVITDGSAILGLGDLGPEAALPVMEGKVMLFQQFAGIDAWPICLNTRDPEQIIQTITNIAPGFGGINLEDISAPRCFEIERRLKATLDIPVMHDDQHGTAVVILSALLNALKVTNRELNQTKVVVNGLGAAGTACCQLLIAAGIGQLKGCDKKGLVLNEPMDVLRSTNDHLTNFIHYDQPTGTLQQALKGADVFIGLSSGNILRPKDLKPMAPEAIVFALANPDPEISPEDALGKCRIYASGRSDYPNQSNNLLAFPGLFRGALDVQAKEINQAMKLAAAHALANVIPAQSLNDEYIIPSVFDKNVVPAIAKAVAIAAKETGMARRNPKHEEGLE
ncbi:NAD-dependent malic enzyme [Candidatus Nitronereus thalassa]|uniref:NAD-dependent malic enzyme n=1 Tax=Candidatus Nitronereus thalassa TaxID=3020898 RepID=A0ABU3K5T7_9BACT|nr:NAD-dependent malic enzyme [Candidatus Nitronereus thalassa]MDT7041708.1 NAD-dependent malic enzyme [Candidatus Nitronereus thalassa]